MLWSYNILYNGNSGSDYWLVTKLAEKMSDTILTDALYYSLGFFITPFI